mgnify:CR=1 FL=1
MRDQKHNEFVMLDFDVVNDWLHVRFARQRRLTSVRFWIVLRSNFVNGRFGSRLVDPWLDVMMTSSLKKRFTVSNLCAITNWVDKQTTGVSFTRLITTWLNNDTDSYQPINSLRSFWNCSRGSGFVNRSASCKAVSTLTTLIWLFKYDLNQCMRQSQCFDLGVWCPGSRLARVSVSLLSS